MSIHQRHSHRLTLFVVMVLLFATLQVPDLWWRGLATSPSAFFHEINLWTPTAVQTKDPAVDVPAYESRCELDVELPLVSVESKFSRSEKTSQPARETSAQEVMIIDPEPSPFHLASWPNQNHQNSGIDESQNARRGTSHGNPATSVAMNTPSRGEPSRSMDSLEIKASNADPYRARGLSAEGGGDLKSAGPSSDEPAKPAPRQVNPLDVPDGNLVLPDETNPAETEINRGWEHPSTVLHELDALRRLHCNERIAAWIDRCVAKLTELTEIESIDDEKSSQVLRELALLSQSNDALQPQTGSLADDAQVRRLAYTILRRCEVWLAVHQVEIASAAAGRTDRAVDIAVAADSVAQLLPAVSSRHEAWRTYLRLDEIRSLASSTLGGDVETQRVVARDVLRRLNSLRLTDSQKTFLARPEFEPFRSGLENWAVEPFDARRFLLAVENFEAAPHDANAKTLVEQTRNLRWNHLDRHHELAETVDLHYRNANVRVAVTGSLLNQLLPVLRPIHESVSDSVLGAQVSGQNQTWTQLAVELVPDDDRVNIQLNATGKTESQTVSRKGPVRVFSKDNSWFRAGKPILLNKLGVNTSSAQVNAKGRSKLIDVKTDYDRVPILGWVVRQLAIDKHRENRSFLRRHVKKKVSVAAKNRINDEVQQKIGNTKLLMKEKIIEPLRDVDVDFKAVEMKTDQERITMRARLAGNHQLSAYTARPRAIKGSVFSTQIHQSAINNIVQQMDLSGQRIELEELIGRLQSRLGIARQDIHSDIPDNVQIRLSDGLPLSVEFDEDRIVLAIRISELITSRRAYRNFVVRAKYTADVNDLDLDLTREGGIELISEKIGFRDQFALRGIFTKVMANNHRLKILRGRFEEDPRLARLIVTQFASQDGWIGISVGESVPAVSLTEHRVETLRQR